MTPELKQLLEEVKQYIEEVEVQIDGEWGSGRTLERLITDGDIDPLYAKVTAALANKD